MKKLIIEARVNEYNTRDDNPHVPWSTAEIARDAAACAQAGASIVHFHARQADGSPAHDYRSYADTVQAIRAASEILIHPTLGYVTLNAPAEERLAHLRQMWRDGISADFAPMDMGSSNVSVIGSNGRYLPEQEERVYQNSTATLHHFADRLREFRIKPYLTAWNIAHLREMDQFLKQGWLELPTLVCFVCTDNHCIGGHPGTPKGLQAFIDFLPAGEGVEWSVCNYGGNLLPLVGSAIAQGGHISIGLGDWHYRELGLPTNAELVAHVAGIARSLGREIATPEEARRMLGLPTAQRAAMPAAEPQR